MILSELKEREYRFKLALRMGLPIFVLFIIFISHTFITTYESLKPYFYIEVLLLLAISIYFIFYIIYSGFDVKITDPISKTFTREYFFKFLENEFKKDYSLVLISIKNLDDINNIYGIKNGDKVLQKVVIWIDEYLSDKDIKNFPIGHIKGGDFAIALKGKKENYTTIFELMALKSEDFKVDDIEVKISISIIDTTFSNQIDYMLEKLFLLQDDIVNNNENINPNELDHFIIEAIKNKNISIMTQDVFENDKVVMKECFVKIRVGDGKLLYPKTYMKIINRLGLGVDFDIMVLDESIKRCITKQDVMFVINVSASSLRNKLFFIHIQELIKSNPKLKDKIVLMFSEANYYGNMNRFNAIIKSFKDLGVKIAVDKLGNVHTSFLYLRDLDIDMVRFDSFYTKNLTNKYVIDGFNVMAKSKDIKTWIKKIENDEIFSLVSKLNVDYAQGNFLSLPKEE